MNEWVPLALLGFFYCSTPGFLIIPPIIMMFHLGYHDHDRSNTISNHRGDHLEIVRGGLETSVPKRDTLIAQEYHLIDLGCGNTVDVQTSH